MIQKIIILKKNNIELHLEREQNSDGTWTYTLICLRNILSNRGVLPPNIANELCYPTITPTDLNTVISITASEEVNFWLLPDNVTILHSSHTAVIGEFSNSVSYANIPDIEIVADFLKYFANLNSLLNISKEDPLNRASTNEFETSFQLNLDGSINPSTQGGIITSTPLDGQLITYSYMYIQLSDPNNYYLSKSCQDILQMMITQLNYESATYLQPFYM